MKTTPLLALLVLVSLFVTACTRGRTNRNEAQATAPSAFFDWFVYDGKAAGGVATSTDRQYQNPILSGFHPDPSIVRVDDTYYLVVSSFAYFPGIPIFRSKDLVNWTQLGHVLSRPSQLDYDGIGISRGIFAPTIRYHDGTFYVVTTAVDLGGNMVMTATDPAGPWSDPVWLPEVDGIDPSLFFDDDGRVYLTSNGPPAYPARYEGHRAIWIQEFDPALLETFGPRMVLVDGGVDISTNPIWIEGPHIFKVDGLYYLIAAEGGTEDRHSEVVFRARTITGPYEPYAGNPILTQRHLDPSRPNPVTSTGHADFVRTQRGDWWAVFLGCRPYAGDFYNTGRETFLVPVRWMNGWPHLTVGDDVVPAVHERPALPVQPDAPVPYRGDFSVRDDFDGPELAPYWNFIRTPGDSVYALADRPGHLRIRGRSDSLSAFGQPAFVGRRQQHPIASATTSMHYMPANPGDRAGIAAFQNEGHFYLMTVGMGAEGPVLQLESRIAGISNIEAEVPIDRHGADGGSILLRIEARGPIYRFAYAARPAADPTSESTPWHILADRVDGTVLSTRRAGGFVGAYFGMFVYAGRAQ